MTDKIAPIRNSEIAGDFYRLAELLEIEGANPFRVRAYRTAARTIDELSDSVAAMVKSGADLTDLPGIGEDLADKISQFVKTRHFKALEDEERRMPPGLIEMASLPGLGPKRIKQLYDVLKIENLDGLSKAAAAGQLRGLPRFGRRLEEKVLQALLQRDHGPKRMLLARAEEIAKECLDYLKVDQNVGQATIAGSCRRRKDTVGDLDILATSSRPIEVIKRFCEFPEVERVMAEGTTRATVALRSGVQVDVRVVAKESFGAALHYFTGSKSHTIAIRSLGIKHGYKINEYGVYKGAKRIAGATERDVYQSVGLPYIEPELREDRGELEAARLHRLPDLVHIQDICGDLHVHTTASDGRMEIEDVAEAARLRGYSYVAITDHTKHLVVAHGLDEMRLRRQIEEIDRINGRADGIRILKSAEVDILQDGSLDLSDDILKELDFTVCSIHYKFEMTAEKQTERIIRAMDNPYFNILGHPTGRRINQRDAYALDMDKLLRAARERGCFMELNAQPERLDLDDIHVRMAKDAGVLVSIATDSHKIANFDFMRFGIDQARRGWLEAHDVLNTRSLDDLMRRFRRK